VCPFVLQAKGWPGEVRRFIQSRCDNAAAWESVWESLQRLRVGLLLCERVVNLPPSSSRPSTPPSSRSSAPRSNLQTPPLHPLQTPPLHPYTPSPATLHPLSPVPYLLTCALLACAWLAPFTLGARAAVLLLCCCGAGRRRRRGEQAVQLRRRHRAH